VKFDYEFSDGGRSAAGYKVQHVGDCVIRAIAIATKKDYKKIYRDLQESQRRYYQSLGYRTGRNVNDGVSEAVSKPYLKAIGWVKIYDWDAMPVKRFHPDNLPKRRDVIVTINYSRSGKRNCNHMMAIRGGKILDTWNSALVDAVIKEIWVKG
jgi:hypothetical protein